MQSEGSIDSLPPERSPLRDFWTSLRSRELHSAEDNTAQNFLHYRLMQSFWRRSLAADCTSTRV